MADNVPREGSPGPDGARCMRGQGAFAENTMGNKKVGRKGIYTDPNRCRFDPMLCWGYADWIGTHGGHSYVRHGRPDRRRDIDEVVESHVAAWGVLRDAPRFLPEAPSTAGQGKERG